MFQKYLQEIFSKSKSGEAGERTYYPVLEELLKSLKEGSQIIVEPRKSSVGIPDFKVQTENNLLIGYVEAKDLGRDLDRLNKGEQEQIEKYKKEYPKLIITNFTEFRLFENGEQVDLVVITQPVTIKLGTPVLDNEGRASGLFERFFASTIQQVHSSKHLSQLLAHKTRVLKGLIREEIDLTDKEETETEKLLETFKKTLKPDMSPEVFSDMYAQTITFGLFVARINSDHQEFTRHTAHSLIPHTIPLLRKVFWILSGQDVPQHIEWQVDEIAEILANTKIEKITEEFFSHGKGRDPIIHFYETFLAEYDSSQREALGVYYTPQPVVSYITRSLNKILKEKFNKSDGFADNTVITLDPAAGTLTFPAEAITIAKKEFESKHGTGGWDGLVREHILKNFYAFEILMAPYAVGHLKISLLLKELGYVMGQDERFELYLTNTLDMSKFKLQHSYLEEEISQESERAFEIKDKVPVLVVMGNPPYSGHSSNKGEWIEKQIEAYKKVDGKPLGEKNPKWLNDDYVKFIRFAQWKIEKTGQGILGFITNHAWLDNPTFRGMRDSLMKTFDEIFILNLHGSALKKEKVPEEVQKKEKIDERDEGVFGIRPGTAITLAIKSSEEKKKCKVYYTEQWGQRSKKFEWLDNNDIKTTEWQEITPDTPSYLFINRDEEGWKKYKDFVSIMDMFNTKSIGLFTARDGLTIQFDENEVWNTIHNFTNLVPELARTAYNLGDDVEDWKVEWAQNDIKESGPDRELVKVITYRPFDKRYTYYTGKSKGFHCRPRPKFMPQMLKDNLAICVGRFGAAVGENNSWDIAFVSDAITDLNLFRRGGNQVLPLYVYNGKQDDLFGNGQKTPNINWNVLPGGLSGGSHGYMFPGGKKYFDPVKMLFYYIYAILYSNTYRERYQEFLKSDFPKIPFTSDYQTFQHLAVLGEQLVELHLLKAKLLDNPVSKYEGKGEDRIEKRDYHDDSKRLYINDSQFFDKVMPEVWNYHIGGYQVLDKWLKDRKGRTLSFENQMHFRKVITALTQTIDIQERIDKFYPEVEKKLA